MDVKLHFKAGGSFVSLRPQFSSNSENVYVAWKNQILGYNTKTGALFAEFKGIKDRIVGFGIHYYDSYECITACSSTGEIITWKIVTHFKVLNKKFEKTNIRTFHIIPSESDEIHALISYQNKDTIFFCHFNLKTKTQRYYNLKLKTNFNRVDVCSNKYFAVVQKNILNVVKFEDFSKNYIIRMEKSRHFTCMACHPEEEIILTGDQTGRVVLWQKLFQSKPSQAVFHWHTLPVKCLGFSAAGSHFYSGGEESVLVRWQPDNHYEKKFLPRLPSTIKKIAVSPNNKFIAIATNDNAIRIIDSRFDNVSLIQHLVIGNNFESGIILDPRTRSLVMNGNVGQIQFYSPYDNSLLYTVDVVGQNKITDERNCNIPNTQVSKIAISKDGLWMGTVEIRKDLGHISEMRLKFWNFDLKIQNFKLNTSIEFPHENEITSLLFQPTDNSELKCISVGGDKKFKIWYLTEFTSIQGTSIIWKCLCIGFFHNFSCKSASFSVDGSLVAVSFHHTLTTWLPDSCHLKCALVHPVYKDEIEQVEFGASNQCHLIVTSSKERLNVWNLLTLTMIWTVPVEVSLLIADRVTANMAVITRDKQVFVFSPASPELIYSSKTVLEGEKSVCAAAFVPGKYSSDTRMRWYQRSPIFFIDNNKELFCLGTEEEEVSETPEIDELDKSLFSMVLPEKQTNQKQSKQPVKHLYFNDLGQKNIKKYFEAPIQTMIPIRIMCSSLLRSMVIDKT